MNRYTFYSSLGLDRGRDPQQIAAQLDQWLKMPGLEPQRRAELQVARAILGDPMKRTEYDRRIDDPAAPEWSAAEMHELVARQASPVTPGWPEFAAPTGSPMAAPTGAPAPGRQPAYSTVAAAGSPVRAVRGAAAALGVLFLFLVLSLFLNWKKFTSSFSYEGSAYDFDFEQIGYGRTLSDFAVDGQSLYSMSEINSFYLSGMLICLVLVLVGSVLLAMGKAPRTAVVTAGVGGLAIVFLAVLNLAVNNMEGLMEDSAGQEDVTAAMLRGGELSTGLGCFIALAAGILVIVVAGFAAVAAHRQRSAQPGYVYVANTGFGDFPDTAATSPQFAGQSDDQNPFAPGARN